MSLDEITIKIPSIADEIKLIMPDERDILSLTIPAEEIVNIALSEQELIRLAILGDELIHLVISEGDLIRINVSEGLGHGIVSSIVDHRDVELSGLTDKDNLVYDVGSGKWINKRILIFDEYYRCFIVE